MQMEEDTFPTPFKAMEQFTHIIYLKKHSV